MAKYVGITIGPIHDTMMLSSKPAALWGASFLFSYLGRELCIRMQKIYDNQCEIIVPYADFSADTQDNYLWKMEEGVGLIHDRIIALFHCEESESVIIDNVNKNVIEPVRRSLVLNILDAIDENSEHAQKELETYFQIYAVCMELAEGTEIVPAISGVLDVLELEKQFVTENTKDYLQLFLENKVLKNCFLTKDIRHEKWQILKKDHTIKSIEDISGKKPYFALVQADGDGMGKVLCSLKTAEQVKDFSKKCIRYSAKASEVIGKYDGVTIYAGGDDLLFLMPVNKEKIDILSVVCELRKVFAEEFKEPEYARCNVSYGIQIVYNKFPLYEAFDMVAGQLFGKAKKKRNSCAVAVQKHSGQSTEFVLHEFSDRLGESTNPITEQCISLVKAKCSSDFLKSVAKHILEQKEIFKVAINNNCQNILIDNLFDNVTQRQYKEDIEKIKEVFESTLCDKITYHKDAELAILAILRFADFYSGGGE